MLKVRLMGTKNDIKWFGKILQRSPKVEVTTGAELTPEETERLAEHRRKKAAQHKAWRERQKAGQPKTRTLKELAAAQKEGEALTPEESARLEAHKSRKKIARKPPRNPGKKCMRKPPQETPKQ